MSAAALPPLSDTQRILTWEDLPASVREIRPDFDPTAEGVLMRHQVEWARFRDRLDIAVCEKGRRTGITFAEAMDDTPIAASSKAAGGQNIWYIGDTKDKGLEFVGYCARFAELIARAQGQGISGIEEYLFEDQNAQGETKHITAWRIRFASGYRITALASRPENIHGLQGIVVIDEAALHANVRGVLESATALLIWGGQIRIISTHRGRNNPFVELIRDIREGLYGERAGVYRVAFDDAVANGLYERVRWMQGKPASAQDKRSWYDAIRKAYGPRLAAMREELDAIPRDGGGVSIPGVWIDQAMPEQRPVLRLALPDDFAERPEPIRKGWCDEWIRDHLEPLLPTTKGRWAWGLDFARHRHFSVLMPAQITLELRRDVPWMAELGNVPTRQQEQILWAFCDRLRELGCQWSGAIDATGPGQTLAEYSGDRYGRIDPDETAKGGNILEVVLSPAWYGAWMQPWVDSFQDGTATYPRDALLEQDFRAVEDVRGIPRVPDVERKALESAGVEVDLYRHGDAAIAAALMWYASLHQPRGEIGFIDVPRGREWMGARSGARRLDEGVDAGLDFGGAAW